MAREKCRICLQENVILNNIFLLSGTFTIANKIMRLANIEICPNDGLPDTICLKCIKILDECLQFVELCETSDLKLRSLLNIQNNDQEKCSNSLESLKYESLNETSHANYTIKSDDGGDVLLMGNNITHGSDGSRIIKPEVSPEININKENLNIVDGKKAQKQQCFTCGKVMSSRFRLKTHLRTHTGERPYSCLHCGKNFSLAQNLKVHIRIHTGEKPLKCSICGECFAQSAGLAAHRRKHTGQLPYKCLLCPRSFRTVGHLQYHVRRHTGEKNYECDLCGRAFITRSDLKQHLLTHSGDRPHVCCVCGLRLTRASHLKRHMQLTHSSIKVLTCSQCSQKFTEATAFEKHIKKHTNAKDNSEISS
ncbi:zinc finger protein 329-like [Achroia grisella]|uniref:zinc finger protein 329-like n=1 Tax=Achroia grisella TaxID=688607 RepID=UPI0027D274F8|nr:zinc finger protein 329-like [Achroia grisella]